MYRTSSSNLKAQTGRLLLTTVTAAILATSAITTPAALGQGQLLPITGANRSLSSNTPSIGWFIVEDNTYPLSIVLPIFPKGTSTWTGQIEVRLYSPVSVLELAKFPFVRLLEDGPYTFAYQVTSNSGNSSLPPPLYGVQVFTSSTAWKLNPQWAGYVPEAGLVNPTWIDPQYQKLVPATGTYFGGFGGLGGAASWGGAGNGLYPGQTTNWMFIRTNDSSYAATDTIYLDFAFDSVATHLKLSIPGVYGPN